MLSSSEWEELRTLARQSVEGDRRRHEPSICLTAIGGAALRAADEWLGPRREADWDWRRVTKRTRDARLELAIWSDDRLCGLALGPVEGLIGMGRACLEYVEGRPGEHELRGQIIPIALATLEEFARVMALPEVRLLGVRPALDRVYGRFGYEEVAARPGTRYLRKRIVQR